MIRLYGIPNCDKVRAARTWLKGRSLPYEFIDLRQRGLDRTQLAHWYNVSGAALINKRSTSWRNLSPSQQQIGDREGLVDLLLAQPTLIQRPVLEQGERLLINFASADYANFFA